jgi:hypothetical protein
MPSLHLPTLRSIVVATALTGLGVTPLLTATIAHAQEAAAGPSDLQRETARNLMDVGDKHFAEGRYAEALESYQGADSIMNVPSTKFAVGKSLEKVGKLIEARNKLLEVTRMPARDNEPAAFVAARSQSAAIAAEIAQRIPTIKIEPQGLADGAKFGASVDGQAIPPSIAGLPIRVNPGEHQVQLSGDGITSKIASISVKEREARILRIDIMDADDPAAPPPVVAPADGDAPAEAVSPDEAPADGAEDEGLSPLVWVGFGVGGAGLIVGTVTGILTLSKASDVGDMCNDDKSRCTPEAEAEADSATTTAHISTIGFALAGAGIAVGVVGLLLSGSSDGADDAATATLQPLVGPGYVGVKGSF